MADKYRRSGNSFFGLLFQDHPALLVACQMTEEPLPCLPPTSAARTNHDETPMQGKDFVQANMVYRSTEPCNPKHCISCVKLAIAQAAGVHFR